VAIGALVLAGVAIAGFVPALRDGLARGRSGLLQRWVERRSPVPRVPLLLSFRQDFDHGRAWSASDLLDLMRRRSDAYLLIGFLGNGYPIGSPVLRGIGRRVDAWQEAIAQAQAGGEALDAGRLCIDFRPELVFKHVDGSRGERDCGTLLGEPQCAPARCRSRRGACRRSRRPTPPGSAARP